MKSQIVLAALATLALTPLPLSAAEPKIDLEAYAKCTAFALAEAPAPPEAEGACRVPAEQGLAGAQYALGAILLSRDKAAEGIDWLEKAVRTEHPPAAYLLARLYLQSDDAGLQARGQELFRQAYCAGYPPARSEPAERTVGGPIDCSGVEARDFRGTWTSPLRWQQATPDGSSPQIRIVVSAEAPKVYLGSEGQWTEVKPGRFQARQLEDTLVVSSLDSGWDLDGKWIESLTVQLLRVAKDEAVLSFVRTVDNVYVPESTGLRTFLSVAEGRASRTAG